MSESEGHVRSNYDVDSRVDAPWKRCVQAGENDVVICSFIPINVADDKSLNTQRKKSRKTPAISTGMAGIGKKPPQAVELEEAVLGACMLEQTAVNAVIDILEPAAFYKEAHGEI